MNEKAIADEDRKKAETCASCPICNHARKTQKGIAYWFVKNLEGGFCPSCQAYERVYGRKAHEPVP